MSTVKVGVVGVGALGRHHARILSEMEGVKLVGVADAHADRGREVAAKHGARWVSDYRQLLPEVDAVSVVVPTVAHLSVAADFLRAGIPVLVEKPLADTVESGRALVELAERHQTLLQVGHIEQFNPAWQAARQHMKRPKYIRAERTSTFTFRSIDIGVVLDLMIHDLELVQSLNPGPIRSVSAIGMGLMGDHEDAVQARIEFESGCIADLTASRISPVAQRSIQCWSETGCVTVDLHQRKVTRYAPSEELLTGQSPVEQAMQPGADIESLKAGVFGRFIEVDEVTVYAHDALTAELRSFIDCATEGLEPQVNGQHGLAALEAADMVLASVAGHQWNGQAEGLTGSRVIHRQDNSAQRRAA